MWEYNESSRERSSLLVRFVPLRCAGSSGAGDAKTARHAGRMRSRISGDNARSIRVADRDHPPRPDDIADCLETGHVAGHAVVSRSSQPAGAAASDFVIDVYGEAVGGKLPEIRAVAGRIRVPGPPCRKTTGVRSGAPCGGICTYRIRDPVGSCRKRWPATAPTPGSSALLGIRAVTPNAAATIRDTETTAMRYANVDRCAGRTASNTMQPAKRRNPAGTKTGGLGISAAAAKMARRPSTEATATTGTTPIVKNMSVQGRRKRLPECPESTIILPASRTSPPLRIGVVPESALKLPQAPASRPGRADASGCRLVSVALFRLQSRSGCREQISPDLLPRLKYFQRQFVAGPGCAYYDLVSL